VLLINAVGVKVNGLIRSLTERLTGEGRKRGVGALEEVVKELLGRVWNRTGEHRDLYCKSCKSFTDHISISHARFKEELFRTRPEKAFIWVAGKLNDVNPVTNLLGRPYKCAKCGRELLD
jgi:hypothetical protein